jgi:hypothetical protein
MSIPVKMFLTCLILFILCLAFDSTTREYYEHETPHDILAITGVSSFIGIILSMFLIIWAQ